MTRIHRPTLSRLAAALAVALLSLSFAACSSSQGTARDDDRVERQLVAIDQAVELTDTQSDRVRAILVAQDADRPSGPPPGGGQRGQAGGADRRAEREARRAQADRQIEAVLTEAQVERYRQWRASQPQRQGPPPRSL
ncbi:hypothetical protein RQM47_17180 [Rubrivirga sp. S365]|uniref:hypothetical protein n=1 Tax=Rubrivirga sp. S365 TaxID=3076080 RepID=UPI0028C67432|nr:hypothetical protein [Rubrivirga sp. S365]MDT7858386.1 hypothetical protein [Rubrivirga sp. S365]